MVQILVKTEGDPSSLQEWAIVELQGDLECSDSESIGGKYIGQLLFAKGKPVLIVGYHVLFGKIVKNDPPLAILKKVKPSDFDSGMASGGGKKNSTELRVIALVKKRLVFKTRPKPIVTSNLPLQQ